MRLLRAFVCLLLLASAAAAGDLAAMSLAQTAPGTVSQQLPSLKDTLQKGLKCRRPLEFEFVGHVAELTEDGTLPLDLTLSTFKWARPKKPAPFPYFQRAMQIRAAEIGVDL